MKNAENISCQYAFILALDWHVMYIHKKMYKIFALSVCERACACVFIHIENMYIFTDIKSNTKDIKMNRNIVAFISE